MIEFKEINKIYLDSIVALNNINLDIEDKEFIFITGPSGAGKSTLLRLLIREEKPTSGDIFFEDVDVVDLPNKLLPIFRQQIGVTFQDLKLIDSRTARENIEFTLEIINKPQNEVKQTTEYLLDLVKLTDRSELLPCQLSGGERQKIAIARALASQPKVLIADEPTGNLDPVSTEEIVDILKTINSIDTTVLVITHDCEVVKKMNARVITLEKGEIVSDKKPKVKKEEESKVKKEKKDDKKKKEEEDVNEIEKLGLPKDIQDKLLDYGIDKIEKLLDLTEDVILEMDIKAEDLDLIADLIVNKDTVDLDNLKD